MIFNQVSCDKRKAFVCLCLGRTKKPKIVGISDVYDALRQERLINSSEIAVLALLVETRPDPTGMPYMTEDPGPLAY